MVSPLQNSGRGAAPLSIPSKSAVAEPQLDDTMELASVAQPDGSAPEVPQEDDIMQLARLGDVTGMEKMFETGEYDATFSDDEGITPLHVRSFLPVLIPTESNALTLDNDSGQQLTTSTPCVSF